jgi:ribosomal protein L17
VKNCFQNLLSNGSTCTTTARVKKLVKQVEDLFEVGLYKSNSIDHLKAPGFDP